eukprot:505597_1
MPPPLNLLVMVLVIIYYIIESIFYCCQKSDLVMHIMPPFIKPIVVPLDEQILFNNCNMTWSTMTTNMGEMEYKAVKYDAVSRKHTLQFDTPVGLNGNLTRKCEWKLSLMDLIETDQQFENAEINSNRLWPEHSATIGQLLVKYNGEDRISKRKNEIEKMKKIWRCGYCRGSVRESDVSISNLGSWLNIKESELTIINKGHPIVCSNCWRVKFERDIQIYFVWECLSIWLFYVLLWPLLIVIIGFVKLVSTILNPTQMILVKSNTKKNDSKDKVDSCYPNELLANFLVNSQKSQLSSVDPIWFKMSSKKFIDAALLKKLRKMIKDKIGEHILRCAEDEWSQSEFYDDFIYMRNVADIKERNEICQNYFKPLADTLFTEMTRFREDYVPLRLFLRYPLDM